MTGHDVDLGASFVGSHVEEILDDVPGADSPRRKEMVARVVSLLVGRYVLREPALFWEELSHTPFGVCAALDALDTLERSALRIIRRRHGHGDQARALMRGVDQALDEMRADCVYMARQTGPEVIIEAGAFEHLPAPLIAVSIDHTAAGLNAAGRAWVAARGGGRCHRVFFHLPAPCAECGLEDALCGSRPGACGPLLPDGARVELSRLTAVTALGYVVGAGAGDGRAPTGPAGQVPGDRSDGGGEPLGAGLLEHIGSGVMFVDRDGHISFANGLARELLGDHLIGARLADVLPGARTPRDERQHTAQVKLDGKDALLGFRCVGCTLDGRPGWVVSVRDITEIERLRAEMDQMRRLSEIGRMCAVVAHEIRNPLAGIMATIQSIEEEAAQAGLHQPLEVVQQEVNRLSELLSGFFAFVRHRPPRRRATDLGALVRRALRSAGPRMDGLACQTEVRVDRDLWLDPDQMHQVLLNLILNAADALAGGGTVRVRAHVDGEQLALEVADDGCGIPRERLGQVFDAFYTTKPGGTGLGLSICYRVVNAHGGSMRIDSAPGIGTRVQVNLPIFAPP